MHVTYTHEGMQEPSIVRIADNKRASFIYMYVRASFMHGHVSDNICKIDLPLPFYNKKMDGIFLKICAHAKHADTWPMYIPPVDSPVYSFFSFSF